ncbi:MAG: protein kinase [Kiritimatiellae bacterium]|nr:protein kinase [Kiritimatiellia bacterium]
MGRTAVKLTSLFGNAVRPEAAPNAGASQTRKIDNYELEKCLGTGGMGTVYKARDEKLDRVVALKVMIKDLRSDPSILDAFRKEARAVAKLNHPNIAQIYSFGESDGKPYIVMEYVAGEHFDSLVFSPEPLDQARVMKTGMDIACGLQVAADAGLVHGDIKPENIVFDDHGVPKLLDFGIASASNAKSTEIWGTPYYIAPEKLRRQRVDFRSDIYCLGATLYHALTKHPPFDGDDVRMVLRARLEGPPPPLSTYRPDIDPEVEAIVGRMLQTDPSDRYPTYGALIADIRSYLRRAAPASIRMDGMFEDCESRPRKPRTPFFQDTKSQIMLLLVLIAMFPYIVFFYVKPSLFPRGYQPPAYATEAKRHEAEDRREQEEFEQAETDAVAASESQPEAEVSPESPEDPETPEVLEVPASPSPPENPSVADRPAAAETPEAVSASGTVPVAETSAASEPVASPTSVPPKAVLPSAPPTTRPIAPPNPVRDEVIDLTAAGPAAEPVKWPSIKVTAIIGGGDDGSALVNGEVVSIGYRLDNGAVLRAVEPQSATFEYKGETKKIFVSKPSRKPKKPEKGKPR